jgi:hypothetical protein
MNIVSLEYSGHLMPYQDDGWFNATEAAKPFGKRPNDWLELQSTKDYIQALCEITGTSRTKWLKVKKGNFSDTGNSGNTQGTWLHPKLAVRFAQWLDPKFAVWCDTQIDNLLRNKSDWRKLRHEAASTYKVMSSMLQAIRSDAGKDTKDHHFQNEAKLINWVLSGEFKALNRDSLLTPELDLLAHLEERNAVLIGRGVEYDKRKPMLQQYAFDWRMAHQNLLGVAV